MCGIFFPALHVRARVETGGILRHSCYQRMAMARSIMIPALDVVHNAMQLLIGSLTH